MKAIIIGDVHSRSKEPYWTGTQKLFNYLAERYSDHILLQPGDLFDTATPHYDIVYHVVADFIKKFKAAHIVTGNHDISQLRGNSLIPLSKIQNVHVYNTIKDVKIDGVRVKFIPYPTTTKQREQLKTSEFSNCDLSLAHISPLGKNRGFDEFEYKFKAEIAHIFGHVHIKEDFRIEDQLYSILGVPQTTRNLEQVFEKRVAVIEDGQLRYDILPVFMTIEDIVFGQEPKSHDNLINILDAPSKEAAFEKYKNYHIRPGGVHLLRTEFKLDNSTAKIVDKLVNSGLIEKCLYYARENKIPNEIIERAVNILQEVKNRKTA